MSPIQEALEELRVVGLYVYDDNQQYEVKTEKAKEYAEKCKWMDMGFILGEVPASNKELSRVDEDTVKGLVKVWFKDDRLSGDVLYEDLHTLAELNDIGEVVGILREMVVEREIDEREGSALIDEIEQYENRMVGEIKGMIEKMK